MNHNPRHRGVVLRHRWLLLGIALLALLAHGAALAGEFVFDDVHSVLGNPALAAPRDWWRLCSDPSAFSGGSARMFRPVLLLSFGCNMAISPVALSLKAGNVLIHACVAMLAFAWLRRLSVPAMAAFAAAAMLAVHPLLSESINLVSARSELLLVFGLLVGLVAHQSFLRGSRPLLAIAGMVLGATIACGSKETGVVLPGLLLAQAWLLRRSAWRWADWGRAVRGVLPVLALVIGYLVLRKVLLGQVAVPLLGRVGADPSSGHGRTLLVQLATMGLLLPRALLQMVFPVGLSMDPPVEFQSTFADPYVLAGWGGVLGLTVAAIRPGRFARVRRLGVVFAWATALPWVLVPLNMPLAEHRLYGPLLGVITVVATWLPRLWQRLAAVGAATWLRPVFAGVLLLGASRATLRALDYRDERLLWAQEIAVRPWAWRAHWGFGMASLRAGDVQGAIEPIATAHALYPDHFDVLRNYAEALIRLPEGDAQPYRAMVVAERYLERLPKDPWARTLLAEANMQVGRAAGDLSRFAAAEKLALSCLEVGEPKGLVYRMAAAARRAAGDLDGALAHLDTSLARGLDHVSVRLDRAAVLRELGRAGDAKRELLRAQQQAPMDPAVQQAMWQLAQPPR